MSQAKPPSAEASILTLADSASQQRRRLAFGLALASLLLCIAGLAAGSEGWSLSQLMQLLQSGEGGLILGEIRAPRTIGAWLTGALFGLAGAVAQGLFRNPLADPYLLGSASGASLGVVLVLGASALTGQAVSLAAANTLMRLGLVGGAFVGALVGVGLTLAMARGPRDTVRLLLAGVIVGVVLGAASDMVTTIAPDALRGKQAFILGSTGFLGWNSCLLLGIGLLIALPVSWRLSRALDALTLGEDSAISLGVALPQVRLMLVVVFALATGIAVSQAGLVAFVGLVSPHLVRRFAPAPHGYLLMASALSGGVLLLAADVLARSLMAPQELPVGVLTAVLGGAYLLWLLHRRRIG